MSCQEKAGFLFSHACKEQGVHACGLCQKQVCQKHGHMLDGRVVCTSCAKKQKGITKMRHRRDDDDYWTTSPYFYGYYHYHGYGHYHHGFWGHDHLHDHDDFSGADGDHLTGGDGSGFENDMGGS